MFKFFFGLDIQFQFAQNLLALMHLCDLPSNQKSGNLYNTLKSLLWLVIVYKVEKSNIGIDIPFPCSMKILIIFIAVSLFNPIQDGLFRSCSWMRGGQKAPPPPKICHTYPTMMKPGTVIHYRKKIQTIYESRDTPLEFCWHQHFFTGNQ